MTPPLVGVIGWSGAGKTTLIARLLPELAAQGLKVLALKHSSHPHPLHPSGSDTGLLEQAGAAATTLATPAGLQLTLPGNPAMLLPPLLEALGARFDLVLVEGWKDGPFPKIEVWREGLGPCLALERSEVVALVTDSVPPSPLPRFGPGDSRGLVRFLLEQVRVSGARSRPPPPARGVALRERWRFEPSAEPVTGVDSVAVEEPLEIRVAGEAIAVTLRTPGDDARLAAGFLFAEGIIRSVDDLGTVAHCGHPGEEGHGNVLNVVPASGACLDGDRLQLARRGTLTTSACGVCGRRSIDDLLALCSAVPAGPVVERAVLASAMERLQEAQRLFARTGGTHAAAALDAGGALLATFEDVGRHNAVDKVLGALLYERLIGARRRAAPRPAVLAISGRASFEMVQKATVAHIPIVASFSAASSLAIDLATRAGVTLATFVRGQGFNVFSHPSRIGPPPGPPRQ